MLQDNDPAYWIQTVQVNLIGTYLCCRAVLPVMVNQNHGQIINLSSGVDMSSLHHMSAYGSSKAAVILLTELLAIELAKTNVHVNVMGPGGIPTGMAAEIRDAAAVAGVSDLHESCLRVTSGEKESDGDKATDLAILLACGDSGSLSGRLLSAPLDDFSKLPERIPAIMGSEIYQLKRVEHP